jgi:hypothetical protein
MAQVQVQPGRRSGLDHPAVLCAQARRRARQRAVVRDVLMDPSEPRPGRPAASAKPGAAEMRSGRVLSQAVVWLPQAASPSASVGAAETQDQAHASAEAVAGLPAPCLARPFQAAQSAAQAWLAHPAASARLAAAAAGVAEAALRDAAVEVVQPQAAGRAEAARSAAQRAAAEVAAVAQHAAAGVAAAQHGAAVAAAAQHAAAGVAGAAARASAAGVVELRVSPGVPQRAAQASPLAFHRDQALPWPARPPSARFARATVGWRSALP